MEKLMEANKTQSIATQIRLRNATDADVPFIFNSWLKSHRFSPSTSGCQSPVYFAQHHKLIEGLCKRASIIVACNDKDLGQIYGYVCCEKIEDNLVVHFIYVKETFRKLGIAKMLLDTQGWRRDAAFFYTHRTRSAEALGDKFLMVYNPYLAFYGYDLGQDKVSE
jgi:ribosomal protein S18 acetylase RimI-like enzyme